MHTVHVVWTCVGKRVGLLLMEYSVRPQQYLFSLGQYRGFLLGDALCAWRIIATVSRPSVTLKYRGHINLVSSKVITQIISLGSSLIRNLGQGTSPKFRWNRVGVTVLSRKPAVSLKWRKIRPRLLLMTNRKLHVRFWLVPKSMTLDNLKWPLGTPLHKTCLSEPITEIWMKIRPTLSVAKM